MKEKFANKRNLILCVLVAYTLIIFLPPLIHGYAYPNNGDDTAFHLRYFDTIQSGNGGTMQYLGQNIVGYPLVWLSNVAGASIDALFLWFNFAVLWLVGIMVFVLVGTFVDWMVGLLSVPMVMFMTPSTLNLYDTGAIYDLVTIGVLLPAALYCLIRLRFTKKWQWLLPLLVAGVLVVVVHTMVLWHAAQSPNAEKLIPSLPEFASVFLGYGIVVLFWGVVFWLSLPKSLKIRQTGMLLICLIAIIVPMVVLVFTGLVGWSTRLALDVSIIFPVLVVCLLGIVLKGNRSKVAWSVVCAFVVLASLPVAISYVGYNSAVKPVDMQAIEYVNALDGDYYSCSPEVAPWIYDRFMRKEYKAGMLPQIVRSKPMTSRSDSHSVSYWWEHNTAGYWRENKTAYVQLEGTRIARFDGDGVEIKVID